MKTIASSAGGDELVHHGRDELRLRGKGERPRRALDAHLPVLLAVQRDDAAIEEGLLLKDAPLISRRASRSGRCNRTRKATGTANGNLCVHTRLPSPASIRR
ncbi:MAG: hypothetical protein AB7S80_14660 [Rhizobiaceae bacterium]